MTRTTRLGLFVSLLLLPALLSAEAWKLNPQAVDRLVMESGNTAKISFKSSTGAANFVRVEPGSLEIAGATEEARARVFFQRYGGVFGISDEAIELVSEGTKTDHLGTRSVSFHQEFQGVPVFGAVLRVHFDASGRLTAANGTFVPGIEVSTTPRFSLEALTERAVGVVGEQFPETAGLAAGSRTLFVYRQGLLQGIAGRDHLVYEIEVTNNGVRELVYIDAHTRKVVNQITGIQDALDRRAFDGENSAVEPGPNYPGNPFWEEGDSLPTGTTEADNMIYGSGETHSMFSQGFGRDSFNGAGATMDAIFDRGWGCPNASWGGTYISFCPGFTSDDVTAHEWGHAYTQYTHGLIYQWQSGALNESYSDVWGETVDFINGRGTDTPGGPRTADNCTTFDGAPPPTLTITGGSAAGVYLAKASSNEPPPPLTVGPTAMAVAVPAGACTAVTGVSGKIAIIDWTFMPDGVTSECFSGVRADNAFNAGATGVIFIAPSTGPLNLGSSANIASVQVLFEDGQTIKAGLPANATMVFTAGTDNTVRWLMGEDTSDGALRDMWNPRCFGNPGKVTDKFEYACSDADQGGVHTNSGVPNHEYALLVDGGTYNGQTVTALGLTKASHVFFRAMTTYQVPTSGFPEHADAMEASCSDLIGINLSDLNTGLPSGEMIDAADCDEVADAILATELRTLPLFCNFDLILDPVAPLSVCGSPLLQEDFEADPSPSWTFSNQGVEPEYTPRDWEWTDVVPTGASGKAMFGIDSPTIGDCVPGSDDQSGVMHLDSPVMVIPGGSVNPGLTFDHWVATEADYDGGNVKIKVNGGAFQVIDPADFSFNPYNGVLFDLAGGNTNPIAGEVAFMGANGGSLSGSWGQSQILLGAYAGPNDSVQIRFDLGVDGCNGTVGWYVDNVTVCGDIDFALFSDGFESGDVTRWSASNP
ncbi:MAG: M4 family metallopeptidase [Thermoanaerobaculia bacterium]|nr:M4 family metallopeptidase [Thermoanaerobaculia bacterium]